MQKIYVSNTILNLTKDICAYPGDSCVYNPDSGRLTIYRAGDLLAWTDEVSFGALRSMTSQGWLTLSNPGFLSITSNPVVELDAPLPPELEEVVESLIQQVVEEEKGRTRKGKKVKAEEPSEPEPDSEGLEA